jgi:hypothetical protein
MHGFLELPAEKWAPVFGKGDATTKSWSGMCDLEIAHFAPGEARSYHPEASRQVLPDPCRYRYLRFEMAPVSYPRRTRLSWADRLLLAEALLTLVLASLAIRLLPFRTVVGAAATPDRGPPPDSANETALKTVWAVRAWARRVPWKAVCFQQGLAVHVMLRRRGVRSHLHYGVSQADGLKAHVWVSAAGRDVIGGEEAAGFTCLATYPPLPA